jgi:hypothetical protein
MSAEPEQAQTWPEYFPSDCPPAEARAAAGTLFRFGRKNPPSANDLTCHWQIYEQHREGFVKTGRQCQACGLSVYLDIQAARKVRGLIPGLKKAHLYSITLQTADGKLLNTPSNTDPRHHTWWSQSRIEEQLALLAHVEGPGAP